MRTVSLAVVLILAIVVGPVVSTTALTHATLSAPLIVPGFPGTPRHVRLPLFALPRPGAAPTRPRPSGHAASTPRPRAGSPSPLCGTNLGLYVSHDPFLTSVEVRHLTIALHVGALRIAQQASTGAPLALMEQAARFARAMGLAVLVVLRLEDGSARWLAEDKQIIAHMNRIFGRTTVYYELGNEPAGGIYIYTRRWDRFISQLKPSARNGRFVGPAWFENATPSEAADLAFFVHHARPTPDALSWHEYTCGAHDSAQYCYDHIARWRIHVQRTVAAIHANGDRVPPIFMTEWNYDASQGATTDPRLVQLAALHFARRALQELKQDGIAAAYHYTLNANPAFSLINAAGSGLTAEGQDFETFCRSQ